MRWVLYGTDVSGAGRNLHNTPPRPPFLCLCQAAIINHEMSPEHHQTVRVARNRPLPDAYALSLFLFSSRLDTRELVMQVGNRAESETFQKDFAVFGSKKNQLAVGTSSGKEEVRVYELPELRLLQTFPSVYHNKKGEELAYTAIIAGVRTNLAFS